MNLILPTDELHIYGTGRKCRGLTDIEPESIGLNRFPLYYPDVKFWLWIDNINFGFCVYRKTDSSIKPYFPFEPNVTLQGACSVATFAISWAIKEGYKRVYLYGILDDEYEVKGDYVTWYHFYDEEPGYYPLASFKMFKIILKEQGKFIEIVQPLK
jgi:hypothetical protein